MKCPVARTGSGQVLSFTAARATPSRSAAPMHRSLSRPRPTWCRQPTAHLRRGENHQQRPVVVGVGHAQIHIAHEQICGHPSTWQLRFLKLLPNTPVENMPRGDHREGHRKATRTSDETGRGEVEDWMSTRNRGASILVNIENGATENATPHGPPCDRMSVLSLGGIWVIRLFRKSCSTLLDDTICQGAHYLPNLTMTVLLTLGADPTRPLFVATVDPNRTGEFARAHNEGIWQCACDILQIEAARTDNVKSIVLLQLVLGGPKPSEDGQVGPAASRRFTLVTLSWLSRWSVMEGHPHTPCLRPAQEAARSLEGVLGWSPPSWRCRARQHVVGSTRRHHVLTNDSETRTCLSG